MGAMMNVNENNQMQLGTFDWIVGHRHGASLNEEVRWTKVVELPAIRLQIGLSSQGWWVVPGPASVTEFMPGVKPVFLLPILEMEPEAVDDAIRGGLSVLGLPEPLLTRFPFEEVVVTGLNGTSEQWINLGLRWASSLPSSDKLINALKQTAENGPTQKIRQVAQKLLSTKRREV